MKARKRKFLSTGQEVITNDGIEAIVDAHLDNDEVRLRCYHPDWPFPTWVTKNREQLTIVSWSSAKKDIK